MKHLLHWIVTLMAGALALAPPQTLAQAFPAKPVRLVVATTPGQTPDSLARIMSVEMAKFLGQPVFVENRPGAASMIGYEYVARQAPADGYTMAIVLVPDLAVAPFTVKELRFDPLKDLPPFINLVELQMTFASAASLPWKTFNEMVAYAKANPGKLNYGSSLQTIRMQTEMIVRDAGIDVVHIPYTAGGPYLAALVAGEIQMAFISEGAAISMAEKFRILAVTGDQRSAELRDVPTFAELGHPQVRGVSYSLNTPAATPKPALDRLHAAALRAMQEPEAKAFFAKLRVHVLGGTQEAAAKRLADQANVFGEVARRAGIKPQ